MKHVRIAISSAAVAVAALVGAAASQHARAQQASQTVADALGSDPRFGTTMKMIYMAGAANRLESAGELTVFAATDKAWDNSPYEGLLSYLSSTGASSEFPDSGTATQLIRGFFVHGKPPAGATDVKLESRAGRPIELDEKTMQVKWVAPDGETHSAPVSGQPIVATNGVIYPVDAVVGE